MPSPAPIPVRPSYPSRGPRHLERAAWAAVVASIGGIGNRDPVAAARSLFRDDGEVPALLLRAAVSGANTTTPGWAKELVSTGVADFLGGLAPQSAMAEVIRRGVVIPIGDFLETIVPHRMSVVSGGWVGEAAPIPVAQYPIAPLTLTPKKAGWLVATSRELIQAAGGQELFVRTMREVAGAAIDSLYLSTAAATSAGLAGLLNGVTPIATTGNALGDLTALAKAVGGTTGSGEVIYIASPGLAAHLAQLTNHKAEVLASVAVPASRIIAIDPAGVLHGVNPEPTIDADESPLIHMESTPLHIATGAQGSGVLATPTQSMFQTAQVAFRCLIDLAWVKRSATAVAYVDTVAWTS